MYHTSKYKQRMLSGLRLVFFWIIPTTSEMGIMEYNNEKLEWGGSGAPPTGFVPEAREGGSDWGFCPLCVCVSVCLSVCLSVRTAKTQKMEISRFFSFWAQKLYFCVFERQNAKMTIFLLKWAQKEILVILGPKSLKIRQGFHSFSQAASPRAKSEKMGKKVILGVKNQKWHHFHLFYHFEQLCAKKVNFLAKTLPAYVS